MIKTRQRSKIFPLLLIACLGLCIYYPALNGGFIADDYPAIVDNVHYYLAGDINSLFQAAQRWGRIVPFLTFAANLRLNGLDPLGYHLFNLLIHLITASLVYWLGLLILNAPSLSDYCAPEGRRSFAMMTALVFLVHPLQTQAVSYIHQRIASLATMFYLLSLCLYMSGRHRLAKGHLHWPLFAGSLLAALLGVFSKEIAFTLPLAVGLLEYSFFTGAAGRKESDPTAASIRRIVPACIILFLIIAAIIPLLTFHNLYAFIPLTPTPSQSHVGDMISILNYPLTQLRVVSTYIRLLFLPYHQTFDYDFPASSDLFEPVTFSAGIFLALILGLGIYLRRKHVLIAFGIFWFFLTLSVESTFMRIGNVIFEHRLYLPMFGFAVLLNALAFTLARKNTRKYLAVMLVLVVIFASLTVKRNILWGDPFKFWMDNVIKAPNKPRSHTHLALEYKQRGELDLAEHHAQRAIKLDPTYYKPYFIVSAVHNSRGDYRAALTYALKAYHLYPKDDLNARQVGYHYFLLKNYPRAFSYYEQAILLRRSEKNVSEYMKLVLAYYRRTGKREEALEFADRLRPFGRHAEADFLRQVLISR